MFIILVRALFNNLNLYKLEKVDTLTPHIASFLRVHERLGIQLHLATVYRRGSLSYFHRCTTLALNTIKYVNESN